MFTDWHRLTHLWDCHQRKRQKRKTWRENCCQWLSNCDRNQGELTEKESVSYEQLERHVSLCVYHVSLWQAWICNHSWYPNSNDGHLNKYFCSLHWLMTIYVINAVIDHLFFFSSDIRWLLHQLLQECKALGQVRLSHILKKKKVQMSWFSRQELNTLNIVLHMLTL